MTTAASIAARDSSDDRPSPPRRARSLSTAVWLYAVALCLITWWLPAESGFTSDDGAYAGQVLALQDGTWVLERTPAVVPIEFEGWFNAGVTPEGPIPYGWHPVYVHLLRFTSLDGRFLPGLQLPSVLGALAAAVLAWRTIERFRPGGGPIAFWLLALGPSIVNATALWAHNLGTALSGLMLWVVVRETSTGTRSPLPSLAAVLAAGVGPLIRTEVALWAVALAVAVWAADWLRAKRGLATAMATVAVVSTLSERLWTTAIYDRHLFLTGAAKGSPPLIDRLTVMVASLVWPSDLGLRSSWVIGFATTVLLGFGLWLLPRHRFHDLGSLLLAVGGLGYLFRIVLSPLDRVKGLFMAWPAVGCAFLVDDRHLTTAEKQFGRLAGTAVIIYTAAVFVTQHPGGAGLEWGGRYLASAYVALAVVAGLRLRPLWLQRWPLAMAMLLGPAILGLVVSHNAHQFNLRSIQQVDEHDVDVVISSNPAAVRTSWSASPQPWFVASDDNVARLLEILAATEKERVALTGFDRRSVAPGPHYRVATVDGDVIVLVVD